MLTTKPRGQHGCICTFHRFDSRSIAGSCCLFGDHSISRTTHHKLQQVLPSFDTGNTNITNRHGGHSTERRLLASAHGLCKIFLAMQEYDDTRPSSFAERVFSMVMLLGVSQEFKAKCPKYLYKSKCISGKDESPFMIKCKRHDCSEVSCRLENTLKKSEVSEKFFCLTQAKTVPWCYQCM